MFKLIALLRRKPGTTHEAFREYYEANHVPLATPVMDGLITDYRRNYVQQSFGYFGESDGGQAADGFDCVTEVMLPDRASVDALFARMADPEISARIVADEEKFIDRASISIMIVNVVPSGPARG
jgi:hypothetical protein